MQVVGTQVSLAAWQEVPVPHSGTQSGVAAEVSQAAQPG